jgi:alpha-galactosidase
MNISYFEQKQCFKIDTLHTSYMLAVVDSEGFLGHVYYGPYLPDDEVSFLMRVEEHPKAPSVNARDRSSFLDAFPTEYAGNGVGDYRESSIAVTDACGHQAVQLMYCGYRICKEKPPIPGLPSTFAADGEAMTLMIFVRDDVLHLEGTLYYSIFSDSDAIMRHVELKNAGEDAIVLDKVMSLCLDMEDENYRMLTLQGSWARERHMEYRPIAHGKQSVGSTRGESSHQEHPFVGIVGEHTTQETGEALGFHFVYSGNFIAQVEKNQYDSLRISMGIHPEGFRYRLEPQEEFYAPEVVMVYSDEGLGKMTRCYHDLYRNHLIRSPFLHQLRPILINNWEATYFDFNSEKLLEIARMAQAYGIEMLVMDDGWFGHRNDDNSSLGDWVVNEDKIHGGLKALVDAVNQLGMKFGIWFEPEMISPDSNLYREHPDWAIQIPGRKPCRSRNQYVLDITRREVRDYVYESVARILRSANIEYVKWDMNRQLTDIGSAALPPTRQGEVMHRYVLAVYELQERLLQEFPQLLLENCSGGGARFDPGMLYYSPQIWCSDDTDAVERLLIQEGTALLYPLSTIGAHVSVCPNHAVGRVTDFATRGHVAMAGTFGYELDITKLSEEERSAISSQVACYHQYNELIREGDYYRFASYRKNSYYDCYGVISKDKSEGLITFVQVRGVPNARSIRMKLHGFALSKKYRIEGTDVVLSGLALKNAGILIERPWGDGTSRQIHIIEEKDAWQKV